MTLFDNDDDGYGRWLEANPRGFVLNSYRQPHPDYLILHRAACKHIARTADPPVRWTTSNFIKVCAHSTADIENWCRDTTGGSPHHCGHCRPYGGG